MPEYKGGMKEFYNYIGNNYKTPKKAVQNKVNGKVVVGFIIEKDGAYLISEY